MTGEMEGEKSDRKKVPMDGNDWLHVNHYIDTIYTLCHVHLSEKDFESAGQIGDGIRVWLDADRDRA